MLINMKNTTNNLLINGNFDLWQRGISFSIPFSHPDAVTGSAPTEKIADRWYLIDSQVRGATGSGSVLAYREQFSASQLSVAGSANYYLTVINGISGATQGFCYVENKQKNAKLLAGNSLILSFYAKTANGLTGATLSCFYRQAINPNIQEIQEELSPFQIYNTWTLFTVNLSPSRSNFSGLSGDHYFGLGFKINRNSAVSIASVKLDFYSDYVNSMLFTDPEEERIRQEEYYISTYSLSNEIGDETLSNNNDLTALSFVVNPNYSHNLKFKKPMYKTPTVNLYSPSTGVSDGFNKTATKDMRLTSGTRGWNSATRFSPTGAATITTMPSTYGVVFNVSSGAVVFDEILVHFVADADIDHSPNDRGLDTF